MPSKSQARSAAPRRENASRYHKISHHFIDQIEQIVLVIVLFGFGAMLASGVLDDLTWTGALIAIALIFVIRPITGLMAETFCGLPMIGKLAIAFLGVRGMGSIYYLAYGQNNGAFTDIDQLWAIVSFAILLSIVIHGIFAGPLIRYVEDKRAHIHDGEEERGVSLSPSNRER